MEHQHVKLTHKLEKTHGNTPSDLPLRPLIHTGVLRKDTRNTLWVAHYLVYILCSPMVLLIKFYREQMSNNYKNLESHTAHIIVSWPSPKQWVIVHTSDLMMIRKSIYILSTITREMGKLKAHSPTYFIMGNWENMLYLAHTLDKLFLQTFYKFNVFR